MALKLLDWFGYDVIYQGEEALNYRRQELCPFLDGQCTKTFNDRSKSGVCTVSQIVDDSPVIICPNRLYANNYSILSDVVALAFGTGFHIIRPQDHVQVDHDGTYVVAFGKKFGKELSLPSRASLTSYFVDWVLVKIGADSELEEFIAVEVQSIDTTGTYKPEVEELRHGQVPAANSKAGLNWENVNKRILPQLMYKGHVLRREAYCRKGLFFVTPSAVHKRIISRLGGNLLEYENLQPGSITFVWYGLNSPQLGIRSLLQEGVFSTTVNAVAEAFSRAGNLPPAGVYEVAIREALRGLV